jgi:DNA processing protein
VSSPADRQAGKAGACESCLRRSWLLAELGGPLDFWARDRGRLNELLALGDAELIEAVAGRRRSELKDRHASFSACELHRPPEVDAVCRHDRRYPPSLRDTGAPWMLYVGGAGRLTRLAAAPVVLIEGTRRASDYGIEMARSLGRGLAAAGVTVVSGTGDGIALAAQTAALEADGRTLAVLDGGIGVSPPARRQWLYECVARRGCAISELPCMRQGRIWGAAASERTRVRLSSLTVVVEATDEERELAPARRAQELGRTLAAVPGRVTSPLSSGTNALLMEGAAMVRGPGDVLELLSPLSVPPPTMSIQAAEPRLTSRLNTVLERVGAGCDTPEKLTSEGVGLEDALLALTELELMGLLGRGDGGRYVARRAFPPGRSAGGY